MTETLLGGEEDSSKQLENTVLSEILPVLMCTLSSCETYMLVNKNGIRIKCRNSITKDHWWYHLMNFCLNFS